MPMQRCHVEGSTIIIVFNISGCAMVKQYLKNKSIHLSNVAVFIRHQGMQAWRKSTDLSYSFNKIIYQINTQ